MTRPGGLIRLIPRCLVPGLVLSLGACAALPIEIAATPASQSPASTAGPVPSPQLVVLVGRVGAMRLGTADPRASAGGVTLVDAPGLPPTAAWLSSAGTTLVATTLDGVVLVSTEGWTWHRAFGDLGSIHETRAFGSIEPVGQDIASIEGDPGSGESGQLWVTAFDGTEKGSIPLDQPAESAPAWLPDGRIVVVVRDSSDRPRPFIADPVTRRLARGPGGAIWSVAIGGGTAATIDESGVVRAEAVAEWLAGDPGNGLPPPSFAGPPTGGAIVQAQPSPDGQALAEVVTDSEGDAAAIAVVDLGDGHEIARFALPAGTNRAVVNWLAAP